MKIFYLRSAVVCVLMGAFATPLSAQTLPGQTLPSAPPPTVSADFPPSDIASTAETRAMQSAAERAVDWLDKQVAPPSDPDPSAGGSPFLGAGSKRSMIKTGATLTLVVSLFLSVVFLLRMRPANKRRQRGGIPDEVVGVLGQIPFVQNQQLQLIRLGTRLLLVATSQAGSQTLGEITDPEEVCQIEAAFREGRFGHLTETLRRRAARGSQSDRGGLSLGSHQRGGRTLLEA